MEYTGVWAFCYEMYSSSLAGEIGVTRERDEKINVHTIKSCCKDYKFIVKLSITLRLSNFSTTYGVL